MSVLSVEESDVYRRYHRPGSGESQRCIINHVALSAANCEAHEVGKARLAHQLIKIGHKVITEAVEIGTGKRRDLVDLTDGNIYELETDPKRAARHEPGICVVHVDASIEVKEWTRMEVVR